MGTRSMNALLHTKALDVGFNGSAVVRDAALELKAGEMAALIGLNGAGKSTLLRTLAGLLPPVAGSVFLNGMELATMNSMERARCLSVVLTSRPQAGLLDVATLVSLGRQPWTGHLGRLTAKDRERVHEAMERTGTLSFTDRSLGSLSDGEVQKVLIARALAQDAPVMLLDEPTAFLDLVNRVSIMRLLRTIAQDMQRAVLLSTHDLGSALQLCDKVLLVHGGTLWTGTPAEAIASGVLDRAFASEGLRFDPTTASLIAR